MPLFLEPGLEGISGVFHVSSSHEAAAFFTLVWWIQGMMPVSLRAVGVPRATM